MSTPSASTQITDLPITLHLGPPLGGQGATEALTDQVHAALQATLSQLLATLGIPARPALMLEFIADELPDGRLFELDITDRLCPCPDELLLTTYSYVLRWPQVEPGALAALRGWLAESDAPTVAEWLSLTVRYALACRPSVLLSEPQAAAYCAALLGSPTSQQLSPVLRKVLDMGISLADRAAVGAALAESGHSWAAAEQLIAALRPDVLEIRVEPSYLRQVTIEHGPRLFDELLPFMRDGLFVELGMSYPTFRFVADDTLHPRAFAFTINHLVGLPMVGLASDKILVNDTSDRLRLMNVDGEAAGNPATYQPAALVDARHKEQLEAAGLTTWDDLGYFILAFAAELRRNGARLMDLRLAEQMLSQLSQVYPALERATREHIAPARLAGILRELAADQLSIRNLRCILDRLLEYELFVGEGDLGDFVRAGMRNFIGHKLSRGTSTAEARVCETICPSVRTCSPGCWRSRRQPAASPA